MFRFSTTLLNPALNMSNSFSQNETDVLRDRTFIEQMKADILRRAEEISDSEESDGDIADLNKNVGRIVAFEEELDDAHVSGGQVKVLGDGEESGESDGEGDEEKEEKQAPETVLELAYLRDPKVFDRDAQTRRGKGRADLRNLTGNTAMT